MRKEFILALLATGTSAIIYYVILMLRKKENNYSEMKKNKRNSVSQNSNKMVNKTDKNNQSKDDDNDNKVIIETNRYSTEVMIDKQDKVEFNDEYKNNMDNNATTASNTEEIIFETNFSLTESSKVEVLKDIVIENNRNTGIINSVNNYNHLYETDYNIDLSNKNDNNEFLLEVSNEIDSHGNEETDKEDNIRNTDRAIRKVINTNDIAEVKNSNEVIKSDIIYDNVDQLVQCAIESIQACFLDNENSITCKIENSKNIDNLDIKEMLHNKDNSVANLDENKELNNSELVQEVKNSNKILTDSQFSEKNIIQSENSENNSNSDRNIESQIVFYENSDKENCNNDSNSTDRDIDSPDWPHESLNLTTNGSSILNTTSPYDSDRGNFNDETEIVARGTCEYLLQSNSVHQFADDNPCEILPWKQSNGKTIDICYFTEEQFEQFGLSNDNKRSIITSEIPKKLAGRLLGKNGCNKTKLRKEYGAIITISTSMKYGIQNVQITCPEENREKVQSWLDLQKKNFANDNVNTNVNNPERLKMGFKLGSLIPVQVLHLDYDLKDLRMRIIDQKASEKFTKMNNEMQLDYSNPENRILMPQPIDIECICIARVSGVYFRAEIMAISPTGLVTVYLLDIGKIYDLSFTDLFKIRVKYMDTNFRAIPAKLPHIYPKYTSELYGMAIYSRLLFSHTTPHPVYAYISRMYACSVPYVHLYIPKKIILESKEFNVSVQSQIKPITIPGESDEEFIDFIELLNNAGLVYMNKEVISVPEQLKYNRSHLQSYRLLNRFNENIAYFQPPNHLFYEDYIEFVEQDEQNNNNTVSNNQ